MDHFRDDTPTMPFDPNAPPPRRPGGSPTAIDRIYDAAGLMAEREGNEIGPFRIIELIGEGGFGAVYLAEQLEPVRRRVALKVIKPGMDSYEVLARFEAERQALAMIDHPNVARVFDAGVSQTGRPYFAMEYVPGRSITRYCEEECLPLRQMLELFIDVCQAVQHAHQKGIIHRDLKPGNILITVIDGRPTPKVIDFGIAKATSQSLTEQPLHTSAGRLMGTPEYMSPEQAAAAGTNAADIDTRTDIYALGVILYELVTGLLPFDSDALRASGFAGVIATLTGVTPLKPSDAVKGKEGKTSRHRRAASRLEPQTFLRPPQHPTAGPAPSGNSAPAGTTADGGSISTVECRLPVPPPPPGRADLPLKEIRGDLDWIIMKAIEKDRAMRYETASALAMDVRRHLGNEPVLAGPPSTIYRFGKFARRNRGVIIGGCAVALALIAGLVVSTFGFVQARRERNAAEFNRQAAVFSASAAQRESTRAKEAEADAVQQRQLAEASRTQAEEQKNAVLQGEKTLGQLQYRLRFSSADAAMQRWDVKRVKAELLGCEESMRRWEWYALASRLDESIETLFQPGEKPSVAIYSPDGKSILVGSTRLTIWDALTRRPGLTFAAGVTDSTRRSFRSLAYSPDGKFIAAARITDDAVDVYEAATGRLVRRFTTFKDVGPEVNENVKKAQGDISFSTDGSRLLVSGWVVQVFDVATGASVRKFPTATFCRAAAWGKDDAIIAAAGNDAALQVWNAATGEVIRTVQLAEAAWGLAFSPDWKSAVVGLQSKPVVQVLNTDDWQLRNVLVGEGDDSARVAFSSDGGKIASVSMDGVVNVWASASGALLRSFAGQMSEASAAFDPDGNSLLTAGGGAVRRWDLSSAREGPLSIGAKNRPIYSHASADLRRMIAMDAAYNVTLWNLSGSAAKATPLVRPGAPKSSWVWFVAISADGSAAMTLTSDGGMTVWNAGSGAIIRDYPLHTPAFAGGELSPDGQLAAVVAGDGTLILFDAASGTEEWRQKADATTLSPMAFSESGRLLGVVAAAGVRVFDVRARKALGRLDMVGGAARPATVCFSPDETKAAAYWENGAAACWSLNTRSLLWRESGDRSTGLRYSASFTRDGRRLLTSGASLMSGLSRVLDPETGRVLLQWPFSLRDPVIAAGFVPGSGEDDRAVLVHASLAQQTISTDSGRAFAERIGLMERAQALFTQRLSMFREEFSPDSSRLTLFNDVQPADPRIKAYESILSDPAVTPTMRRAVTEYLIESEE